MEPKLTPFQKDILDDLLDALGLATASGLLDIMQEHCKSPDSINDVCDAVLHMTKPLEN